MNGQILLPFTGSQESLYAIEFAWALAKQTKSTVNAQHVVNVHGALEFVGIERPGIVGSGPYLGAYETVCQSLRDIAEKLADSYAARAEGQQVEGEVFVDDGETVGEICKRLSNHDLVVMGHRQRNELALPNCQTVRLSLAELLSHYSSIPLLIIQRPITQISELAVFCSMDHINTQWLRNCLAAAKAIGASCSLTFFASGAHEEEPMNFVRDLKQALPESKDIRIRLVTRMGECAPQICEHHLRGESTDGTVLAVIPTMDSGDQRITGIGESPSNMLRRLDFDAVLFWPEESTNPLFCSKPTSLAAVS